MLLLRILDSLSLYDLLPHLGAVGNHIRFSAHCFSQISAASCCNWKKTNPRPSSVFFFLSVCMMRITETLNFVRPGSMQDGLCPNAADLSWGDVVRCRTWNSQRGLEGPHSLLDLFCSRRRKAFPPHRQMSKQILSQRFELQIQAAILSLSFFQVRRPFQISPQVRCCCRTRFVNHAKNKNQQTKSVVFHKADEIPPATDQEHSCNVRLEIPVTATIIAA